MSAIATYYWILKSALPALVDPDSLSYGNDLAEIARSEETFTWSGYIFAALLPILQTNYGVHLTSSEPALTAQLSRVTESSHFILTYADREKSLAGLDPARFDPHQLRKDYEAFNATEASGAEDFLPAGIAFLRDGLQGLEPDEFLIFDIGC